MGTHWVAFYVQNNDVTYFDSFGVERELERLLAIKHKKKYL